MTISLPSPIRLLLLGAISALLVIGAVPGKPALAVVNPPTYDSANRGSSPLRVSTSGGTLLHLWGAYGVLPGATATFTPYDTLLADFTVTDVPVTGFDDWATVIAPAMPAGPVKITLFNPGSVASSTFMTVSYGDTVVELTITCTEASVTLNANIGDYVRLIPTGVCNDTFVRNEGWNPEGKWSIGAMGNVTATPDHSDEVYEAFDYIQAVHPLSRVGSYTNPAYWPTTQPGLMQSEFGSWHPVVGLDWNAPYWTGGYNAWTNGSFTDVPLMQVNEGTTVGDNVAFLYEKVNVLSPAVQIPIVYAGGRIDPPAPTPEPAPAPAATAEPLATPTVAPVVIPTTAPPAEPVALPAGAGGALINGVSVPVTVAAAPGGNAVVVSAGGVTVEVGGTGPDGAPLPLAPDGSLIVAESGGVNMGGSGFSPNSTVSLFLYSTPTKLGELPVSVSGSYSGSALIPAGIEPGSHTIQAVGYTPSGETLALSIGVTVKSAAAIRGASPSVRVAAGAKVSGERFAVTATGVQPRCTVRFWVKGSTATVKAGVAGRARAVLQVPQSVGMKAVTATVSGTGCDRHVTKSMIRVSATGAQH